MVYLRLLQGGTCALRIGKVLGNTNVPGLRRPLSSGGFCKQIQDTLRDQGSGTYCTATRTRWATQQRRWASTQQENESGQKKEALPPSTSTTPTKPQRLRKLLPISKHENIYTLPNLLTFSRLLSAPLIGYFILHEQHLAAVSLFAYAGFTDLIDGWIARRYHSTTVVGTVIDPMADKTLMTILTVCLAIKGGLPIWLAGIILGRDAGLGIAAIYYRWISLPPPKTFSRYWDFSLPSAEVHPTTISKYNTALQLLLIGACTAQPLITADVSTAMSALQYLVATTTVWSGASYIYSKDAVKILTKEERESTSTPQ